MIVIRGTKTFCFNFDWPKYVDENLKHEIEFIKKGNEPLAENKIKNEIEQLLLKYKHGNNIHERAKQQGMDQINLFLICHLKSPNKHLALQNLCIYYKWKNITKQYKNNKLNIWPQHGIAPTWNDEFELPDGSYSVSDIKDYIAYIIKKHETLTTTPLIHVYINRINNRLVFKIKHGYKLELKRPETMKLFGSRKKLIDKTKMEKTYQVLK